MTTPTSPQWTEDDSHLYQNLAPIAVPARAEQLATLLTLLPFERHAPFHAVEIGAGEGYLSAALLACFPQAAVTALDGSPQMRAITRQRLAHFGRRARVEAFELTAAEWYAHLHQADAVLSSLCLHHLSGPQKQALFSEIHRQTSPRAALLIADLVAPQRREAHALFAATWDKAAESQAQRYNPKATGFAQFQQAQWNLYHFPDPVDQPSPLYEQLQWLSAAGFTTVDCFWMQAGHAIYGGYKAGAAAPQTPPAFEIIIKQVEAQLNSPASA